MKKIYFLSISLLSIAFSGASQTTDPSFETGATGTAWTQASTNFGTPLCDAACGVCGGPCVANTGSWYAWFGGAGGVVEVGSVEQSALVPFGSSFSLNMMVKIPDGGDGVATDGIVVSIDGAPVGAITGLDTAAYQNYTMFSVPVNSAFAGTSHVFKIEGGQTVAGSNFNILVDDVNLIVDGTNVGLFEFETGENEVIIFPNPAQDIINLQFRKVSGDVDVQIVDLAGKVVSNQTVGAAYATSYVLNTSDFNNGSYIMTVSQNGNVLRTENIVINK